VDLASGRSQRIVRVPGPQWRGYGGGSFDWSPDGRWLAYTRVEENRSRNIWIVPSKGGDPVKVTRLNAFHSQPAWGPGGRYLFCYSSRDGSGIYAIPLKREDARAAAVATAAAPRSGRTAAGRRGRRRRLRLGLPAPGSSR